MSGVRPATDHGPGHRTPTHHAPLRLRGFHLRSRPGRRGRTGAVRTQGHRDHLNLYIGQFLSKKRTAQALAELFGTPASEGTVVTTSRRESDGLTGFLELVRGTIADAPVANFDETAFRVAGKLHWVHSASTDTYSLITVHKRGTAAMDHADWKFPIRHSCAVVRLTISSTSSSVKKSDG